MICSWRSAGARTPITPAVPRRTPAKARTPSTAKLRGQSGGGSHEVFPRYLSITLHFHFTYAACPSSHSRTPSFVAYSSFIHHHRCIRGARAFIPHTRLIHLNRPRIVSLSCRALAFVSYTEYNLVAYSTRFVTVAQCDVSQACHADDDLFACCPLAL